MQCSIRPTFFIGGLFLGSLCCFLLLLRAPRVDGQLIGSDGAYYYVYLHSLIIDRDLDFRNEYAHYQLAAHDLPLTHTGLAPNKYAIGPACLWLPFYLGAHLLALLGQLLGIPVIADGYGYLYQAAISLGSLVYGTLGFVLSYRVARRWFSIPACLGAVALFWLASNAFYYMVFEPSMAHMVALFSVACLLTIWVERIRRADPPPLIWASVLGGVCGLVMLVRLQDSVVLLVPVATILWNLFQAWQSGDLSRAWRWLGCGCVAACAALLVFMPQLIVWHTLYGDWLANPYQVDHDPAFYWLQPQIVGVLFSTFHGLFAWHPIYVVALCGVPMLLRHDRGLGVAMIVALGTTTYLIAAWWAWWQGDSFGGRMFLDLLWFWVIGLAAFLDWAATRRHVRLALLLGTLLIGWNGLSLAQYRLGYVPMSEPLTWQQMTIERMMLPLNLFARQ